MPIAPNQTQKLIVLLHMWNRISGKPRYEMMTPKGLIAVADSQHAREYAERNGYSGIKVVPS